MDLKIEFLDLNRYKQNPEFYSMAVETAFEVPGLQVETQLQNGVFFTLAFADDIPCGVVRFTRVYNRKTVYCLRQVFVREQYRKMGIASKMYELALPELKKRGATKILSFILENNRASQKLHYKHDFKYTEKGSYANTDYDAYGELDEMWVNTL